MAARKKPADPEARIDHDALGEVLIEAGRLWGAETQRALENFPIGIERFRWGRPVLRAFALVKRCAARTNAELGCLAPDKAEFIARAADELLAGRWDAEFPLPVFQSGSGTLSNMNVNEVLAFRARQLAQEETGQSISVHPNDDVNHGQSSNDVFPTVMHVATVEEIETRLIPSLRALRDTLAAKSSEYAALVMLGRTHLQDAIPVTLGQVFSGWTAQLDQAIDGIRRTLPGACELAIGGTAVGTGLNTHPRFGELVARRISAATGRPFVSASNKFAALSAHDALVVVSAALRTLAGALLKIANDVRWYASGPRGGIGELTIPANEPGSSIMPGKINPSQCEALTMVAVQVFGNDHAVAFAGSQGNFQLNTYKPILLHNLLESIELLSDGCQSFTERCAAGIMPEAERIRRHLGDSLMLVTALNPHIGYEKGAQIANLAHRKNLTLRDAALQSGFVTAEQFDQWIRPEEMTHPAG